MLPDNTFAGRVGIVTGGATGIGFGIAKELARLGAQVVLASRKAIMGAYVSSHWEKIGGWAAVIVLTLADLALLYSIVMGRG